MMGIKIKSFGFIALALGFTTAYAAVGEGMYMGLQVGATNTHNKERTIIGNGTPPATAVVKPSNTGVGARIFAGYNINQYAAIEGGFTHYATSTYNTPTSVTCNNPSIQQNAFDLEGKGMMSVWNFGVFGKAGMSVMRQKFSGSLVNSGSSIVSPCGGGGGSSSTTTVRPLVGLGVSYDLTQNWVMDLSWTRVLPGSGVEAADFVGLGIAYHIVDRKCGQFLC